MIELIKITIASQEAIVEFRNKLLNLLLELEFKDMEAVRIVTKISDFIHYIYYKEKSFNIELGFEKKDSIVNLLIAVDISTIPLTIIKEKCLFVNSNFINSADNKIIHVQIPIQILNKQFNIEPAHILQLKEKIIIQSKSELMSEIKNKNNELNKLLEDLKKSAGLIQSEKMRALGVLTAGVAHELNNPMMGILNFIQYCLKKTPPEDKRHEPLKDAELETKRCIDIVANLLTFSHLEKEDGNFKPVNLKLITERIIKILSYRFRNENITIQQEIAENIPFVLGHENRLQQAILNLITNALDAMKLVKNKILKIKILTDNKNAKIIISDTGEGMDEDTQKKIFEPFFTTKVTGSGTGLGLSVCESIITEHNGTLLCHTKKNVGTEFSITLPLEIKE